MAGTSVEKCSSCGEAATNKCGGCKLNTYCSKDCQVKDWPKHKAACHDHRLEQILARAAGIIQAVFLRFRELTLNQNIVKVEVRTEELIIYKGPLTPKLFPTFNNSLMPNDDIKASVLSEHVCQDAVALFHQFTSLLLKDIPVTIKEVEVVMEHVPRKTNSICDDGEIRTNWPDYSHHMWHVTSTKSGKMWYIDVTGAQYGIYKTLWATREFDSLYVECKRFFAPGSCEKAIRTKCVTRRGRTRLSYRRSFEAVALMDRATVDWTKTHKMRLSALLKLDSQEFEMKKAELLHVTRQAVYDYVTNIGFDLELLALADVPFNDFIIQLRARPQPPKRATLEEPQKTDPDAHHMIVHTQQGEGTVTTPST